MILVSLIFLIGWFLLFLKLLLFWLWLWQLKEYHLGRFLAHFETKPLKKIVSSFWRVKYPKPTLKIIVILLICIFSEILLLSFFPLTLTVIFTFLLFPFLILFFQIPTIIWRNFIIRKARQKISLHKNLVVIGITGSYGKTSTKEFIADLLEFKFGKNKILRTKGHQNSEVGVSRCVINNLTPEHKFFVVEMGAYNKGGIALLCSIVKPKIGVVTGVNEQHLSTFGSMENLLSAEGGEELVKSLPKDGVVFLNGNNRYCLELYKKIHLKKHLYGKGAVDFTQENILGAQAVAREIGMTEEEIEEASLKVKNRLAGIKIKKGIKGTIVVDSSYSANPTGVLAHIEYLKKFSTKKIIIMPCLIELGSSSSKIHREIGKKISQVCDLAIITTADRFSDIRDTAGEKAILIEEPRKIIDKVGNFCKDGDIILLEGRVPLLLISRLIVSNDNESV